MKELSIEEKAKAYDEAIARAKELLEIGVKDTRDKRVVLSFFPELKEDEDERTRKELMDFIYVMCPSVKDLKKKERFLDWLEKQGESKSYSWKPTKEQYEALDYAYNSCSDTERGNYYEGVLETLIEDLHRLEKQGEQKPAEWSEIDEEEFQIAIDTLFESGQHGSADWLQSLKNRYTWTPSEEQMDALQYVYRNLNPPLSDKLGWNSLKTLELMFEQLKKLKE